MYLWAKKAASPFLFSLLSQYLPFALRLLVSAERLSASCWIHFSKSCEPTWRMINHADVSTAAATVSAVVACSQFNYAQGYPVFAPTIYAGYIAIMCASLTQDPPPAAAASATVAPAAKLWSLKSFQLEDISNDIKTWTQIHASKWEWPLDFGVCYAL